MSQSGMIMPICKDTEGNQLSVAVTRYAPVLLSAGVALLVSLWYQFGCQEVRNTFFSDSRHYLETCRQLVSLVHRTPGVAAVAGSSFSDYLMLDGPILPLLPSLCFAALGKIPTQTDWQPFVFIGCLLHAASAALVCALMWRLSLSRLWALVAGLVWATYPPAIIVSGRFLTEMPAVFYLLAMTWSASRLMEQVAAQSQAGWLNACELGVWNGIVLLLKPVLSPAWLAVDAVALAFSRGWKVRLVVLTAVIAGLALVVVPWMISTITSHSTATSS